MAAYAAVASLGQTLDQILHPDTQIILYDEKVFKPLRQKVQSLQNFLENCARGVDGFEIFAAKIRDAAYQAEDIIELKVYDFKVYPHRIPDLSVNLYPKMLAFLQIMIPFSRIYDLGLKLMDRTFHNWPYRGLVELIEEIDHMLVEAKEISERCNVKRDLQSNDYLRVAPSKFNIVVDGSILVGLDYDLLRMKDRLTGSESRLEVVSIVGMGGIGKTTLAENIYRDSLIVYHFNVRAWITVSQEYNVKDILLQLLGSLGKKENDKMLMKKGDGLAEQLHKILYSRRYLIVMDDLWSTKAWDDFKRYFPDNGNGSRIILTTRLESVAIYASCSRPLHFMNLLSAFESWKLLQKKVFKVEECPSQLHEVGKRIAFDCQGLPLAIVVIAGILINVNRTIDEWEKVAENMHSITNRDSDTCLEILFLSYSHLPRYLKPCFLYLGVFPEDSKIVVSKVIKLWAAEGFLKKNEAKTFEEVAEDHILELAERSLISVFGKRQEKVFGRMKNIGLHDLVRDLCIREARKEKLLHVIKSPDDGFPQEMNHQRCVCIYPNIPLEDPFFKCLDLLSTRSIWAKPISFARSLLYTGQHPFPSSVYQYCFRLLKVLDISHVLFFEFPVEILTLYNLRYLAFSYHGEIPESISKLWNLQTLIFTPLLKSFSPCPRPLPLAIWSMPRLRHLRFHVLYLSDFPCVLSGWRTRAFLANLQTLSEVSATFCQEEILKEIPNLRKVGIWIEKWDEAPFYINNLACLEKLEVLKCSVRSFAEQEVPIFPNYGPPQKLAFPTTLKELVLRSCRIPWKDMSIVGSLPNLEVLKLRDYAFVGSEWEPIEGEFSRLSFLDIDGSDLMHWEADVIHFPLLKHLVVENCGRLAAIPSGIGEIATLEIIEIDKSSPSAVTSVEQILEEQLDLGNDRLRVHIYAVGATFY